MRLIQANAEGFGFEFSGREKELLLEVLAMYPLIPVAHHRLSRNDRAGDEENQKLLEESLAAHRRETRQRVQALLTNPRSFQARDGGFDWTVTRGELEWILQVLNDVRVGSWLALGSPTPPRAPVHPPTPETRAHLRAMDLAGEFEMIFIAVLDGGLPGGTQ
jgi:hypothetical protein